MAKQSLRLNNKNRGLRNVEVCTPPFCKCKNNALFQHHIPDISIQFQNKTKLMIYYWINQANFIQKN